MFISKGLRHSVSAQQKKEKHTAVKKDVVEIHPQKKRKKWKKQAAE